MYFYFMFVRKIIEFQFCLREFSFLKNLEVMKRDNDMKHLCTKSLTAELSIMSDTRNPTANVIENALLNNSF